MLKLDPRQPSRPRARLALAGVLVLGLAAAGCGEPAARAVGEAAGSAAAHAAEGSANRSWVKPAVGGGSTAGGGCIASGSCP
jgi:hypothetical protein